MADNGGSDSGVWIFVFFALFLGVGGWLVWRSFEPQLTTATIFVRSTQMNVASLWTPDDKVISVPMADKTDDEKPLEARLGDNERIVYFDTTFGQWRKFANTAKTSDIQSGHLRVMTFVAMYVWRIPMMLILGAIFLIIVFRGPTSRYRRYLGLEQLLIDQAKSFKVVRPFLNFNPNTLPVRAPGADVPAELPIFSEALGPEEWLAYYEIPMPDGVPDRAATEKAFADQLGERWKGPMSLKPHQQVLLAAFCLKTVRQRDEAEEMLGRLACCWDHKGGLKLGRERGLLGEARKILRNKKLSEKTLANCNRHAYVTTAMIRALDTAREEGGVLAPAQFVWLRAHDRALWYPLNNLGRTAYHMEALGACSHYRAEKQVNRPIPQPRVADGYTGILEHLQNPLFARPIPAVDYTHSKKKKPGKNPGIMKPKAA